MNEPNIPQAPEENDESGHEDYEHGEPWFGPGVDLDDLNQSIEGDSQ